MRPIHYLSRGAFRWLPCGASRTEYTFLADNWSEVTCKRCLRSKATYFVARRKWLTMKGPF